MNKRDFILNVIMVLTFPIWGLLLLIMALVYIFSPDDAQAIGQGIGKGYTEEDLKNYYIKKEKKVRK